MVSLEGRRDKSVWVASAVQPELHLSVVPPNNLLLHPLVQLPLVLRRLVLLAVQVASLVVTQALDMADSEDTVPVSVDSDIPDLDMVAMDHLRPDMVLELVLLQQPLQLDAKNVRLPLVLPLEVMDRPPAPLLPEEGKDKLAWQVQERPELHQPPDLLRLPPPQPLPPVLLPAPLVLPALAHSDQVQVLVLV